jgi:hypothetical protein
MANEKDRSAARRREEMRRQRQQRDSQNTQRQQQSKTRKRRTTRRGINPWWYIGGVLVLLAAVVVIFIVLARQQGNPVTAGTTDSSVLKEVTSVNPALLSQVGTADVKNNFQAVKQKQPILMGPTGKPEFLYYGAEFCPYCAGQRWGVVVALSRFGTFTKLPEITSSGSDVYPNTATFSFYQSSYSSNYIDFVPLEVEDGQGQPLQKPTPDQQKLIDTYNAPPYTQSPGFPFIDVGNQYVVAGPTYVPDVLAGMSQKDIAASLSSTDSEAAKKIMATANYLTASICLITNNQPGSVCGDSTIQQIAQSMPKATANTGNSHLAISSGSFDINVPSRRRA